MARGRTSEPSGGASERSVSPTPSAMSTSTTSASASRFERLQSHMLTSLLSLQSIPPPNRQPVTKNKEPLSLPTTTRNFRGFVQKSGPVFLIQDTVHETLMWDYPARTLVVMAAWAVIALHPYLLVPLPPFMLSLLLLQTYQARYPPVKAGSSPSNVTPAQAIEHAILNPTSTGHGKVRPPLVPEPPHEGSVKYYENLRDIQNMMKMITDAYDLLAPFSVHLNWSSPSHTLLIFQGLIITTLVLFLVAPYLPYRIILLIAGEGAFIVNHPWTEPVLTKLLNRIGEGKEGRKIKTANRLALAQINEWIKMDQLPDDVWTRGWREVEVFENERYTPQLSNTSAASQANKGKSEWSGHNLRFGERKPWTRGSDGYADESLHAEGYTLDVSRQIAMSLEDGWSWVDGDEWRIDFVGRWSSQGVDDDGWLYTDSDWHTPSVYAYGHKGQPLLPATGSSAATAAAPKGVNRLDSLSTIDSEDECCDDDELPHDLSAATSKTAPKSLTRKRRWLRRAVWVGTPKGVARRAERD